MHVTGAGGQFAVLMNEHTAEFEHGRVDGGDSDDEFRSFGSASSGLDSFDSASDNGKDSDDDGSMSSRAERRRANAF